MIKTKIGVGSVVKVGETEEKIREGRTSWMRKEFVGCFQAVVGKNKFVVKF